MGRVGRMSLFSRIGEALRSALTTSAKPSGARSTTKTAGPRSGSAQAGATNAATQGVSPGQSGATATVEVDPRSIGAVWMTYSPALDGAPDPGEVVWTWVPFEERDGRGKDRPVLVVAAEKNGTYLAVQLTSKAHDGNAEYVPVGSGAWDSAGRPSWVNIDRVFRLHAAGMRRETAGLPAAPFAAVEARLRQRYGWR
jgi:hypothetical protein